MKIAVMGAGAIGGYFGGRLAVANNDVTLIARGAHLAAMQQKGLQVRSPLGDFTVKPVQATDDPADVGPVDVVLFMVKLYDTKTAAQQIKPLVGPETIVISFQNGIDAREMLSAAIGAQHVLGGVVLCPASVPEPGVISHNGKMAKLIFGEFDNPSSQHTEALRVALSAAGIESDVVQDIEVQLWSKFALIASMSAVNCLMRLSLGAALADDDGRLLLTDALREVVAVAAARGVMLPKNIIEGQMAFFEAIPNAKASMLQDLERGKRLEVHYLSGAVARLGAEVGVQTPIHRTAFVALKPYADGKPITH